MRGFVKVTLWLDNSVSGPRVNVLFHMRSINELIDRDDPAFPLVQQWAAEAVRPIEFLPASSSRENSLLETQVTTRSPMGAIIYETGGVLVDRGWLRFLGSGHPRLARTLPGWN